MKTQSIVRIMVLAVLGTLAAAANAAPDFSMIERARATKQAEQQKSAASAKKCPLDELAAAARPK